MEAPMETPMPFKIVPPVVPYRGTRGIDAYGAGGFNASRIHGGVAAAHMGLDFVAQPGDKVVAPCEARLMHIGRAYTDSTLGSLHLLTLDGQHWLKLLYAMTGLKVGTILAQGDLLGAAEDVAAFWGLKLPKSGPMTNHVHLELSSGGLIGHGGMPLDPALHLEVPV